jgi:hypothetical protein
MSEKIPEEELENLREIYRIAACLENFPRLRGWLATVKDGVVVAITATNRGPGYDSPPALPDGDNLPDVPLSERGFGV